MSYRSFNNASDIPVLLINLNGSMLSDILYWIRTFLVTFFLLLSFNTVFSCNILNILLFPFQHFKMSSIFNFFFVKKKILMESELNWVIFSIVKCFPNNENWEISPRNFILFALWNLRKHEFSLESNEHFSAESLLLKKGLAFFKYITITIILYYFHWERSYLHHK